MFQKDVPGFCTEVKEAFSNFSILFQEITNNDDVRESMKKKVVEVQDRELMQMMLISSKINKVLLNGFNYDGKCQRYLKNLDFREARAVFLARYRMLPVKKNFPNRWNGMEWNAMCVDLKILIAIRFHVLGIC